MKFFKIFFIPIFTLSINILAEKNYDLEVLVDGLDHPWSLVELSSGEFLLTELPGNLKLISKNGSKVLCVNGINRESKSLFMSKEHSLQKNTSNKQASQ